MIDNVADGGNAAGGKTSSSTSSISFLSSLSSTMESSFSLCLLWCVRDPVGASGGARVVLSVVSIVGRDWDLGVVVI